MFHLALVNGLHWANSLSLHDRLIVPPLVMPSVGRHNKSTSRRKVLGAMSLQWFADDDEH